MTEKWKMGLFSLMNLKGMGFNEIPIEALKASGNGAITI